MRKSGRSRAAASPSAIILRRHRLPTSVQCLRRRYLSVWADTFSRSQTGMQAADAEVGVIDENTTTYMAASRPSRAVSARERCKSADAFVCPRQKSGARLGTRRPLDAARS